MRYFLSVNLDRSAAHPFSFRGYRIRDFLQKEAGFQPEPFIALTVLSYDRKQPGLLEQNWGRPWYNDEQYFMFLAGSVLFRNGHTKGDKGVPTPEEVLDILLKEGDNHYQYLKGNYYLVLLRKARMEVDVYSSPMSLHPAFVRFTDNQLLFSNYLEAFHALAPLSVGLQGLVELSLFDHCLGDKTIYEQVKLIQGGHCYRFMADGQANARVVYDVSGWYTPAPGPRADTLEGINEALKRAINRYIESTDRLNVALTGGFDGRLNFSFIEPEDYHKVRAFSYGMHGSLQISIPEYIAQRLGFRYEPVYFNEGFEAAFPTHGMDAILLTGGITGFNRGIYPYAYNTLKEYSRSCMIGQCDMIRPTYNNPAGVIFNDFSRALFFGAYDDFKAHYKAFARQSFLAPDLYSMDICDHIYEEIQARYIKPYPHLDDKLRFFFFLLKESIMKYWHTEFHLVDIFVDDYVSFADLDFLETLFGSAYAGIYKGLFAKNQWERRKAHDLYVDLMSLNNNKLNYFYNDRFLKPGWLKFGLAGLALSAAGKQLARMRDKRKGDTTFNMDEWSHAFYRSQEEAITRKAALFNTELTDQFFHRKPIDDSGMGYRYNRMISLKIWLDHLGIN
ncbi:MAG: hypothetical protein H6564_10735 [Lewinellaceae bacterium]|nr:hypothetical protein [Lewinellaceae bacterium]